MRALEGWLARSPGHPRAAEGARLGAGWAREAGDAAALARFVAYERAAGGAGGGGGRAAPLKAKRKDASSF